MKYTTDIYVRKSGWDMYIVCENADGNTITVSANKDTMGEKAYNMGWESYKEWVEEEGCIVTVHYIGVEWPVNWDTLGVTA